MYVDDKNLLILLRYKNSYKVSELSVKIKELK